MVFSAGAHKGIAHHYAPKLVAFEHTPSVVSNTAQNLLIWVGGLGDGLITTSYPTEVANGLPNGWSLAQALLSSSYTGWGTSSLQSDAEELSECVEYFRTIKKGRIVLMGHSTGCQDVMEYLVGTGHESRLAIDGAIIQAPVSDREATISSMPADEYRKNVSVAQGMVAAGKGEDILPGIHGDPCCARRWLSLAVENGDDDYFSSDLSIQKLGNTFGRLPARTPLCILHSGEDEYVSEKVDKKALLEKWSDIITLGSGRVDTEFSGVIEGATHNLQRNPHTVVQDLVKRVRGFLQTL